MAFFLICCAARACCVLGACCFCFGGVRGLERDVKNISSSLVGIQPKLDPLIDSNSKYFNQEISDAHQLLIKSMEYARSYLADYHAARNGQQTTIKATGSRREVREIKKTLDDQWKTLKSLVDKSPSGTIINTVAMTDIPNQKSSAV